MRSERKHLAPPFAYRRRVFTGGLAAGIWCALGAAGASSAADLPQPCGAGCGPGVWIASDPARAPSVTGNAMTIDQISDREIFNWQSFNVGKDASVTFRQPSSSAIALNRIHAEDPSRILGTVTANGQIYLLNPNGIVFGAGAQVDAHSLVASSLNLADDIFEGSGIVNAINQSSTGRAAFESAGEAGPIVTEPGSTLRAHNGGRILIIAPEIEHGGRIETPEGQTILAAASDRVYLAAADDPNLRGLLVEVDSGGSIDNLGEILAERGNVSLVGLAINQAGRIRATTSVNLNGSVRLLARDLAQVVAEKTNLPVAQHAGTLTLTADSVTEVAPEIDSTETAPDAQPQLRSNIELMGHEIRIAGTVSAPGGEVSITATTRPDSPLLPNRDPNDSQVIIEPGAVIDVSGTDTTVLPVTRNVVEIELRANELRDAPLQRDGVLRGKKVTVDIREGTPLADVSGAIDAVRRGVGERTASGGRVSIRAEGDIELQRGATVDFSGGAVTYTGGVIETTRLLSEGRVIDIADALPDFVYDGIITPITVKYQKWGVTETHQPFGAISAGVFDPGYIEGKDAGAFELVASGLLLAADLRGGVTVGEHQRLPAIALAANTVRRYDEVPLAGALVIGEAGQIGAETPDFRTPDVTFTRTTTSPLAIRTDVTVNSDLIAQSGIGQLAIYSNGRIELPRDIALALPGGGALALTAGELAIDGDIAITSGQIELTARATRATPDGAAQLAVGATSRLDASGAWLNETPVLNPEGARDPVFLDGGAISLRAEGALTLAAGSVLDVSGGARLDTSGEVTGGSAGSITIELDYLDALPLRLDATLRGDALVEGGSLSITGSGFRIRNGAATAAELRDATYAVLAPAWFHAGGFSSIDLTATHTGIVVESGTALDLVARNRVLDWGFATRATGSDVRAFSHLAQLTADARLPIDLGLHATSGDGLGQLPIGVTVETGARLATEPGGALALTTDSSLIINGTLAAPGGTIDLEISGTPGLERGYRPDQAIWLGANAKLLAPAAFIALPDDRGLRRAEVFAGGAITLRALRGYVIADPGAVLDVSGRGMTLDLAIDSGDAATAIVATPVAAGAGAITLQAREGILLGATLRGAPAPIAGAAGGSLTVILEPNQAGAAGLDLTLPQFPTGPRDIVLGAGYTGDATPGAMVPERYNGLATLSAEAIEAGGFDVLTLRALPVSASAPAGQETLGRILFDGDVTLMPRRELNLQAPIIEATGAGEVRLEAAHIALGDAVAKANPVTAPSAGDARLSVHADLIDLIGTTTLLGFGASDADAAVQIVSAGDLRLQGGSYLARANAMTGALRAAVDLDLTAQRIYPTTRTDFTLSAPGATIALHRAAADAIASPWSAGATLRVIAAEIVQDGALYAPFGTIELHATEALLLTPGSLTATMGGEDLLLFGQTEFGDDWIQSWQQRTEIITALPEKRVVLDAPDIEFATGAVIDVSGGGDLLAYEFVPGPGGSTDLLRSDNAAGAFAIVPKLGTDPAPVTPSESIGFVYTVGSTIVLEGGVGQPSGEFTILPARYALLPGAYLVTPLEGSQDLAPGQAIAARDGGVVVPGRFAVANTTIEASRWSGFLLYNGSEVRKRAEYLETRASEFFAAEERTSPLPQDAGAIAVVADERLVLQGSLPQGATRGRGVRLDVSARDLAVVGTIGVASDRIELLDRDLNALGAESLLLGGTREVSGTETAIEATARTVTLADGIALDLPELLLVATDQVEIGAGASVRAAGASGDRTQTITTENTGALVRVAAGAAVDIDRAATARGTVSVAAGALLAGNAIALDASRDTIVAGVLDATSALLLGADRISLGTAPDATDGLVLDPITLANLSGELHLVSRSTIDLYGEVALPKLLDRLVLDAAAIRGYAASAVLEADTIVLRNGGASDAAAMSASSGDLLLRATDTLLLDEGTFAIAGFDTVALAAGTRLITGAEFDFAVAGDLLIDTPLVDAVSGAELRIMVSGDAVLRDATAGKVAGLGDGLAATIEITAAGIDLATRVVLPSGTVRLNASGDVTLRSGALIDVAGRDEVFVDRTIGAPGGSVELTTDSGAVRLLAGSVIDVTGAATGGDGGRLTLRSGTAPEFEAGFAIRGGRAADTRAGAFALDAGSLTEGSFNRLNAALAAGEFTREIDLRLRDGDLTLAATEVLRAADVSITVDAGLLDIAGTIDASNAAAGRVRLVADAGIRLRDGARIAAASTTSESEIELATLGALDLGVATLDVSGIDAAPGGVVRLIAPRTAPGDLAITRLDATITGAARIELIGEAHYAAATVTEDLRAAIAADNDVWLATAVAPARLGTTTAHLLPGVVIASAEDLVLPSDWDLVAWRYGGEAGLLTLRAAGDLVLAGALSDGIARGVDPLGYGVTRDVVLNGPSWSYRLVAGADAASPDTFAVAPEGGSVVLDAGARVQTGTGSIRLASGSDLVFAADDAVLMTFGENRGAADYGYGEIDQVLHELLLGGDFVAHGGDIRIDVGGDIEGRATGQFVSQWLSRIGGTYDIGGEAPYQLPSAWSIEAGSFRQNIGALAGGDVVIRAGGDLRALSVMLPNNGQPRGAESSGPDVTRSGSATIEAGGDVLGGMIYVADGVGRIRAGGFIGAAAESEAAPILALATGAFDVVALRDLVIETVLNPTMIPGSDEPGFASEFGMYLAASYFFTYGVDSAVSLTSLAGDITLRNDTSTSSPIGTLTASLKPDEAARDLLAVLPAALTAHSLRGDILFSRSLSLFPSPSGDLELLADGDVTTTDGFVTVTVNLSDADPALLPSLLTSADPEKLRIDTLQRFNPERHDLSHAATPVHATTDPARIVARNGFIGSPAQPMTFVLAKPVQVDAGGDVVNAALRIQHATAAATSSIRAAGSIRFSKLRTTNGAFEANSYARIDIAGPGRLELAAAGDIDLGTSNGVLSVGDTYNPALPDVGADLVLFAGLGTNPDDSAFAERYLAATEVWRDELLAYRTALGLTTPAGAGWETQFADLTPAARQAFLRQVLFLELKESGVAAASGAAPDYERGFDAIEALFPDASRGDISLLLSRISTLDGGDIELLAPGGAINAGVTATGVIAKGPAELGIVAQRDGDIRAVLDGDFLVNQSRVFALDGGDILIWSSRGDIDAGRGAKTAIASPPPTVTFDAQGNAVVEFPAAIAGSGIRGSVATAGRTPGNVYLFAPAGFVSAGDAGIGSAGNITIGAIEVIGADNIDIGGVAVGVPQADVGGIGAGLTGVGDLASAATAQATSQATERAQAAADDAASSLGGAGFAMVTVEVIGFGE